NRTHKTQHHARIARAAETTPHSNPLQSKRERNPTASPDDPVAVLRTSQALLLAEKPLFLNIGHIRSAIKMKMSCECERRPHFFSNRMFPEGGMPIRKLLL